MTLTDDAAYHSACVVDSLFEANCIPDTGTDEASSHADTTKWHVMAIGSCLCATGTALASMLVSVSYRAGSTIFAFLVAVKLSAGSSAYDVTADEDDVCYASGELDGGSIGPD